MTRRLRSRVPTPKPLATIALALQVAAASPDTPDDTITVRTDGPVLTVKQAKAMSPAALADALLMPGHAPVVEAVVGVEGMAPPPPPGVPVATPITLYLAPHRADTRDFCARSVVTVTLAPVSPGVDRTLLPARPNHVSVDTAYRWLGDGDPARACPGSRWQFFRVEDNDRAAAFATIRALVTARRNARAGKVMFPLSVDDPLGRRMRDFERSSPRRGLAGSTAVFTDPQKALEQLPIESVNWVGPAPLSFPNRMTPSDRELPNGHRSRGTTVYMAGEWFAEIAMSGNRIVRLWLLRETPPPF